MQIWYLYTRFVLPRKVDLVDFGAVRGLARLHLRVHPRRRRLATERGLRSGSCSWLRMKLRMKLAKKLPTKLRVKLARNLRFSLKTRVGN